MSNIKKINSKKYREVPIDKIIINGKEKSTGIITAEETKKSQELNVTVYTQKTNRAHKKENTVPRISKGRKIFELFKKIIFHHKRR